MTLAEKIRVEARLEEIPYEPPVEFYERETEGGQHLGMLLESRRRDLTYGTKAIAVTKPGLQFTGKGNNFEITAFGAAAQRLLGTVAERIQKLNGVAIHTIEDRVLGTVERRRLVLEEELRIRQAGLGGVLRQILSTFRVDDADAGLYGAFAYDYVRQGENIGSRFSSGGGPDVNLLLPLELVTFDEIKRTATRKTYKFGNLEPETVASPIRFGEAKERLLDLNDGQYMEAVARIISEIASGEMIQAVLSRTEGVRLREHPFSSYKRLATINPSPYCFFYNMGDNETLFGASPEVHVRIENGKAELRPLAGTRRRKGNAVDDHFEKLALITDPKERSEHVMLVDLARNDLSRVCYDVQVARFMETVEFPNLYHIGSSVTGTLKRGMDALDAILTTLPQGTLSGAPKVRAMREIELLEGSRRGYYGGCVGMIAFNGDCNTAITIRSVNTKDGYAYARAGAGVVLNSKPETELAEVNLKNANQLTALGGR
ncbi:MAG: anthranilate synthase component I family protein [Nanoarchaeota archaeon]